MKKLFFLAFCLTAHYSTSAQLATVGDTVLDTPGNELIKAANHNQLGFGLLIAGSTIMILSPPKTTYNVINGDSTKHQDIAGFVLGGAISLAGLIYTFESYSHIRRAGKMLNQKRISFS